VLVTPAPLRYVGVVWPIESPSIGLLRPTTSENCGRRTIGPALRSGRAYARIQKGSPPGVHRGGDCMVDADGAAGWARQPHRTAWR
jgi:hypothetical protein